MCLRRKFENRLSLVALASNGMAADSAKAGVDPHIGVSHGPGVFTDEEFEQMAREVVTPDLNGFEFFIESHGTKFYRKYREVSDACVCGANFHH